MWSAASSGVFFKSRSGNSSVLGQGRCDWIHALVPLGATTVPRWAPFLPLVPCTPRCAGTDSWTLSGPKAPKQGALPLLSSARLDCLEENQPISPRKGAAELLFQVRITALALKRRRAASVQLFRVCEELLRSQSVSKALRANANGSHGTQCWLEGRGKTTQAASPE